MKKRIISILLALCMCVSLVTVSVSAAKTTETVLKTLLSTGFDGTFESTGLKRAGKWGANNGYTTGTVFIDSSDASNSVLKISSTDGMSGIDYEIPTEQLSNEYKMDISFKFKVGDTSNTFYASLFNEGEQKGTYNDRTKANNANLFWLSNGALYYGNNGQYAMEQSTQLASVLANEWYTVKSQIIVDGTNRPAVTTVITDANGTEIGKYENTTLSGISVITPADFVIMGKNSCYVDDLDIGYYEEVVVEEDDSETFLYTGFDGPFEVTGLKRAGGWGANNGYTTGTVFIDSSDASNPVLKMSPTDGTKSGIDYEIPTDELSDAYKMSINFKFKVGDISNSFYASLFNEGEQKGTYNDITKANNSNLFWLSNGALYYGNNGQFGVEQSTQLASVLANEWYTVKSQIVVDGTNRPLVTTVIKDANGTVIGKYENITLSGISVISPADFVIMGKKSCYVDDLKIGFNYEKKVSPFDFSVDFSEDDCLARFGRFDAWGNQNVGLISKAKDDENDVVKIKNYNDGTGTALVYTLPTNLPDKYTMKLNYKFYATTDKIPTLMLDAAGAPVKGKGVYEWNGNTKTAIPLSVSSGYFKYTGNVTWATDTATATTVAYESNTWYNVSATFDVTNGNKPVATVLISDSNGKLLGGYRDTTIGPADCKNIEKFKFNYGAGVSSSYAVIDDLSVAFSYEENTIADKKLIFADATEGEFNEAPQAKVSGAKFVFGKEYDVTATLTSATENIAVTVTKNGTTANITWDEILKNKEYTLTVNYGAYEPFVYTFTAPAGVFDVKSLEFYKGDTKLESMADVSVGDTVTLKATFVNETGESESASLIISGYKSDAMVDVDYDDFSVESLNEDIVKTFNFTVTEDMNIDELRGFVWDSVSTMVPLCSAIEL